MSFLVRQINAVAATDTFTISAALDGDTWDANFGGLNLLPEPFILSVGDATLTTEAIAKAITAYKKTSGCSATSDAGILTLTLPKKEGASLNGDNATITLTGSIICTDAGVIGGVTQVEGDYVGLIKEEVLQQVIQNDSNVLDWAEDTAQAQMESMINQRYDVANIFSQTGDHRDPLIIMYMMDIVLYHVHTRIPEREVTEKRQKRYDKALDFLKKVNEGLLTPAWPRVDLTMYKDDNQFRLGSNTKDNHRY